MTKFYKATEETPRNMNLSGRANAPIADEFDPDESVGDESCFDGNEPFERATDHAYLGQDGQNTLNSSQFTNNARWSVQADNAHMKMRDFQAVDQMSFQQSVNRTPKNSRMDKGKGKKKHDAFRINLS